jgi:hypothetical protein
VLKATGGLRGHGTESGRHRPEVIVDSKVCCGDEQQSKVRWRICSCRDAGDGSCRAVCARARVHSRCACMLCMQCAAVQRCSDAEVRRCSGAAVRRCGGEVCVWALLIRVSILGPVGPRDTAVRKKGKQKERRRCE